MSMTVAPRRIELRALIEEARRRERQRRWMYAGLLALLAGAGKVGRALSAASPIYLVTLNLMRLPLQRG